MILNVIFHGAWLFLISEERRQILALSPDESVDHKYGVGSITGNTFDTLPRGDYEFRGITGTNTVWYPNNEYCPVISAKRQALKSADPSTKRYCCISMPIPEPVNIIPLEPYNTVGFLKGKARPEVTNLKQFPSVYCFVYQCSSLNNLQLVSANDVIVPSLPVNQPPYQQTANLHVLATYWTIGGTIDDDHGQMERCFDDMGKLLDPELDLKLHIDTSVEIKPIGYSLPPGVTQDEVELPTNSEKIGVLYGTGRNCQNSSFFLNETDAMQLP